MQDLVEQACLSAQKTHHIERRSTMHKNKTELLTEAIQETELQIVVIEKRISKMAQSGEALHRIRGMMIEALQASEKKEEK